MKTFIWTLLAVALSVNTATAPYDESAYAPAQIQASLQEAKAANKPALVVFGANWCGEYEIRHTLIAQKGEKWAIRSGPRTLGHFQF